MGGYESKHTAWKEFESLMVNSPKVSKSFSRMAFFISSNLLGTTSRILCWNKSEVATVDCIPVVEGVSFLSSETTKIAAFMDDQCSKGATSTAFESSPFSKSPISQATYPPNKDLHAEPEPFLAILEISDIS